MQSSKGPTKLGKLVYKALAEVDDFLGNKFAEEQKDLTKIFIQDLYLGRAALHFIFHFVKVYPKDDQRLPEVVKTAYRKVVEIVYFVKHTCRLKDVS